jgi:hypothetical protein
MTGLPPGAIANFLSFDHAINQFRIVASGSVTADGSYIITDRGSGISTAGWGCNCPPYEIVASCESCGNDPSIGAIFRADGKRGAAFYADGTMARFGYDECGYLVSAERYRNSTLLDTRFYDRQGRTVFHEDHTAGEWIAIQFDPSGSRAVTSSTSKVKVVRLYDAAGRHVETHSTDASAEIAFKLCNRRLVKGG